MLASALPLDNPSLAAPDSLSKIMGTHRDGDLARLSAEILRYLESHRDAADTVEGIARWWIKRQRLEDTLRQVQWALDRLVADARIEVRVSPAGRTLYQLRGRIPDAGQDAP